MPRRRNHHARMLTQKAAELAFAAPQVVAHRFARAALMGASPSARDRREVTRMFAEKQQAFLSSWMAMWLQAWTAQQAFAAAWLRTGWRQPLDLPATLQEASLGVLAKGLAPVHRAAVANARRLSR